MTKLLEKIGQIIQFIQGCFVWFQSDQINKLINNIKILHITVQIFISFTSILLLIFFSKIPDKIKSKVEVVPISNLDNDFNTEDKINTFRNYSHYIPSFQKNIVAEPYFFRI